MKERYKWFNTYNEYVRFISLNSEELETNAYNFDNGQALLVFRSNDDDEIERIMNKVSWFGDISEDVLDKVKADYYSKALSV